MPRNKDGYYRATFTAGKSIDGNPKRVTIRAKTKKDLELKLAEAKRLYSRGYALGDMSVYEWADRWYRVNKANATDTQKRHYRAKLDNDILPYIGQMPLRDVRSSHLQSLLNDYAGGKLGTVNKIKIAICQLFDDAETEGIIERSPAARLELPVLTEASRRPLTPVEKATVLEVAKTHQYGVYMLTMLFTGLRRGECLALTVGDINFQQAKINVNKALELTVNDGELTDTKAGKLRKKKVQNDEAFGTREVPIPDILLPYLIEHCSGKSPDAILFSRKDGKHATKSACLWWWKSFKRQCHILSGATIYRNKVLINTSLFDDAITPHYLRHTYATDLYAAGVDETARKEFLGHASSDVTAIYTKMSEAAFSRAADLLNEYYSTTFFVLPESK